MVRRFKLSAAAVVLGGLFFAGSAWACEKHAKPQASTQSKKDASTGTPVATGAVKAEQGPVAATCSCDGPSDCTCKKGKCACKSCRHKRVRSGQLIEPIAGQKQSSEVSRQALQEARAGTFI